jgi:hypothetical protein
MNPEDLAGQRWKQAAHALANRNRVQRLYEEANTRAAWLRERLPTALHEARLTQAQAIVAGKPLPNSDEPARLQAELATLEEQLPAIELAFDIVARDLHDVRRGQQDKWHQEQARAVAQAQWVVHEEGGRKNREALAQEQALLAWVDEPQPDVYVGLAEAGQLAAVASRRRAVQPLQALARSTDKLARRVRINELTGGRYG